MSSTGGMPDLQCRSTGGSGCTSRFTAGPDAGTLTATASDGYTFVGWRSHGEAFSGCRATPCKFTMPPLAAYVTAVFQKDGAIDPLALYTDITSGPNTGGENGDGIYLTVFGKNFGAGALGKTVKVYVDDVEVKRYMNPGGVPVPARGRPDIQQIATQIGLLGRAPSKAGSAPGAPLAIKVVVDGRVSNPNQAAMPDPTFVINPGNVYFVAPDGKDTYGMGGGDFSHPFRSVQQPGFGLDFALQPASVSGAYGRLQAGDFLVLRGGTYQGVGFAPPGTPRGEGYFLQALNKSGCPLGVNCEQGGGDSSGPITVMGYPGERAFVDRTNTLGEDKSGGAFSAADSARQRQGYGAWWTIVNLTIEAGFNDGPINVQRGELNPLGAHWRVVNNELTMSSCRISTRCRAGGIAGNGIGNYWVGNYIHDVYDKPDCCTNLENHGIYIGGDGSYEIAYNRIEHIPGGNGIQTHRGESNINNVSIHHNVIHDVGKHGINLADGSRGGIVIWNNLVYTTVGAGLRMGGTSILSNMRLYNNVFFATNTAGNPLAGAISNDMQPAAGQVDIRNNIFWPTPGTRYFSGDNNPDFTGAVGTITHNLYFGGSPEAPPAVDQAPRKGNPQFRSTVAGAEDFHIGAGPALGAGDDSPAVAAVVIDDYDIATAALTRTLRGNGGKRDIGAFGK